MNNTRYSNFFQSLRKGLAPRNRSRGSAMISLLLLCLVFVVLIGTAFRMTQTIGRNADRAANLAAAQMVAEGCINYQAGQWHALCQNSAVFAPATSYFANLTLPTQAMFPSLSPNNGKFVTPSTDTSYSISNYSITALDGYMNPISGQPVQITLDGQQNQIWQYMGTVTVTVPGISGPQSVSLSRIFQLVNRSPWTYAIFYNGDLEINPGANMTVTGPVFTNGKLDTTLGGGALTFNSQVADVLGANISGNVSFQGGRQDYAQSQTPMGINGVLLSASDTNPNNDSYHELIEPPVTTGTNIADPFSSGTVVDPMHPPQRFYDQADLIISLSATASSPVTILNQSGNDITTGTVGKAIMQGGTFSGIGYSPVISSTRSVTVNGSTVGLTLQDSRESATMHLVNVNVGALKALMDGNVITTGTVGSGAVLQNPYNKGGILVYIQQTDPISSGSKQAIRVFNGTALPTGGLSVVSPNPVYVMGNLNTSGTWQPASVVGDAVTILSQAWVTHDSTWATNTSIASGGRVATSTTINAAIMSGNVPTTGTALTTTSGTYSGGVENFTRFQEDWNSSTLTYNGSMVALYASQQATGKWPGTGTVYNPPTRNWNYETRFSNQPPPGSFTTTSFYAQRWIKR